ncbi:MAG: hypothetical protein Fur006_33040 [Coleofasciculaceae cyanobacterium]
MGDSYSPNDRQHTESLLKRSLNTVDSSHLPGEFSKEEFNLLTFNLPFEMDYAQPLFYRGLELQ